MAVDERGKVFSSKKIIRNMLNFKCVQYDDDSVKIEKTFPLESKQDSEIMLINKEEVKFLERIIDFLGS